MYSRILSIQMWRWGVRGGVGGEMAGGRFRKRTALKQQFEEEKEICHFEATGLF